MRLFLLRHADADTESNKTKALRSLSLLGQESLKVLVEHFPAKDLLNVVEIRHSPWVRAQKTASEFCKLAGLKADLREVPLLEPYADFRILADIISATDKDLILVGHEPSLGMLASYLLSQENQTDIIRLKKGGMLFLERMETANVHNNMRNFWQLRWMMSPRDFLK